MRTYSSKPGDADKEWYIIDVIDVVLGRLVAQTAAFLRGKHKPTFTFHVGMGDYVVIINADKVALTDKRLDQEMAYRHSGRPGDLTAATYHDLLAATPERAIKRAVKGILPHNFLGCTQFKKLHVYAGPKHPHVG